MLVYLLVYLFADTFIQINLHLRQDAKCPHKDRNIFQFDLVPTGENTFFCTLEKYQLTATHMSVFVSGWMRAHGHMFIMFTSRTGIPDSFYLLLKAKFSFRFRCMHSSYYSAD